MVDSLRIYKHYKSHIIVNTIKTAVKLVLNILATMEVADMLYRVVTEGDVPEHQAQRAHKATMEVARAHLCDAHKVRRQQRKLNHHSIVGD
jgi:hypothetical protein